MASLFSACKSVVRNNSGGTFNIGGYDIDIEYYGQQDIDDDFRFGNVAFGDQDESKILLVAGSTITIPEGYTLTPDSPKKSLVIFCNNLVNNGTISMYQKAPNVLPHDYFILENEIAGTAKDIIVSAYADNAVTHGSGKTNGANGTNRNCGSGGTGSPSYVDKPVISGSGYAFGGGAGSGGFNGAYNTEVSIVSVDSTYPMHGGKGQTVSGSYSGGVGNPSGINQGGNKSQAFGCGGRIIVFCCNFNNNGLLKVDGTSVIDVGTGTQENSYSGISFGGASGAGAIDLFYTNKITEGTLSAIGGKGLSQSGDGGNGSITLSQWSQTKLFKTEVKYFSQANVAYLLTQLSDRIKDSRMGE